MIFQGLITKLLQSEVVLRLSFTVGPTMNGTILLYRGNWVSERRVTLDQRVVFGMTCFKCSNL
jgi:hypothetical protein